MRPTIHAPSRLRAVDTGIVEVGSCDGFNMELRVSGNPFFIFVHNTISVTKRTTNKALVDLAPHMTRNGIDFRRGRGNRANRLPLGSHLHPPYVQEGWGRGTS